jgi:hypothetical protein
VLEIQTKQAFPWDFRQNGYGRPSQSPKALKSKYGQRFSCWTLLQVYASWCSLFEVDARYCPLVLVSARYCPLVLVDGGWWWLVEEGAIFYYYSSDGENFLFGCILDSSEIARVESEIEKGRGGVLWGQECVLRNTLISYMYMKNRKYKKRSIKYKVYYRNKFVNCNSYLSLYENEGLSLSRSVLGLHSDTSKPSYNQRLRAIVRASWPLWYSVLLRRRISVRVPRELPLLLLGYFVSFSRNHRGNYVDTKGYYLVSFPYSFEIPNFPMKSTTYVFHCSSSHENSSYGVYGKVLEPVKLRVNP